MYVFSMSFYFYFMSQVPQAKMTIGEFINNITFQLLRIVIHSWLSNIQLLPFLMKVIPENLFGRMDFVTFFFHLFFLTFYIVLIIKDGKCIDYLTGRVCTLLCSSEWTKGNSV